VEIDPFPNPFQLPAAGGSGLLELGIYQGRGVLDYSEDSLGGGTRNFRVK